MPHRDAAGRLEGNSVTSWNRQQAEHQFVTFQVVDGEGQRFAVRWRFHGVQVDVQPSDIIIILLRREGEEGRGEVVGDDRLAAT